MPFGDSITVWGCRDDGYTGPDDKPRPPPGSDSPSSPVWISALGGYRGYLGNALMETRVPWDFVGSQHLCGNHEGHAGETIEWLANITTAVMTTHRPDVVLFQAGTNDFFWAPPRGTRDPKAAIGRLRLLLDATFAALPTVTMLVSTIPQINATRCAAYHTAPWRPPNCPNDMPANIDGYNALLPAIVQEYQQEHHRDIRMHDINRVADFVASDMWIWGIHFNNTGFQKLSNAWLAAMQPTLAGWR